MPARGLAALLAGAVAAGAATAQPPKPTVAHLVEAVRAKAQAQLGTAGMQGAYRSFLAAHGLSATEVPAADFAVVRLLFEATRDAGLWNLHWTVTDRQPDSDHIWRQWGAARRPSAALPTAHAECDELSALFAFLVRRAGVRGVGLFWPASNHTVAVWELKPPERPAVRVVVPTTQIFLAESDLFGTRRFDPWSQRRIYEYTRRDAPDALELPAPLVAFFLRQLDKHGGATDLTLQRLRYLREALLQGRLSPEQASVRALALLAGKGPGGPADVAAVRAFAQDVLERP